MFATVNIKKLHGLTSRNKCNTRSRALGSLPAKGALNSDQVISLRAHDGGRERAPGPGLMKSQATSKSQAASIKLSNQPVQSPSDKRPNQNNKRQASSLKLQAH